jgi:hypothetical protein
MRSKKRVLQKRFQAVKSIEVAFGNKQCVVIFGYACKYEAYF